MKKRILFFLCALTAVLPLRASAESLPEVLSAVAQGLEEGLEEGLALSAALPQTSETPAPVFPENDLALSLCAKDPRLEEGRTTTLTLTAVNPYDQAADVAFTLALPARLSCAQPLTWQAQLPPAKTDPQTGKRTPSVSTITREITLLPGSGESEQVPLTLEMQMGPRFYRAKTELALCVPRIDAAAALEDTDSGRIQPGEVFALAVHIVNDGDAPKDVAVSYLLPNGISPAGDLPEGFALNRRTLEGVLRAEAGAAAVLSFPLRADEDALNGDADASRLMSGILTVDQKRIDVPALHIVGPMINARLTPQKSSLEEGGTMDLAITVVNTGLAAADVELSCLLPEGLSIDKEAVQEGAQPRLRPEDGALLYTLHMDAATQTDSGVAAAAKEILLRVRADVPAEELSDRLLGASLAWQTNEGATQLSEAAALRVHRQGFLGLDHSEWNGILLAGILMLATICCLCSAMRSGGKQDEYCFE